jgi:hypothetical protein
MEKITEETTASGIVTAETKITKPFDPAKFRLSQDFQDNLGVKQALLTVPVRKPDKQWFVRTHPDEAYRLTVAVIEMKEDRETYLVDPSLCEELASEITPKLLVTTINRAGVVFLWPIRNVSKEGRQDEWSRTSMIAAGAAKTDWIRLTANMSLGAYEVFKASDSLPNPEWPDTDFAKLLETAFTGRVIDSLDHDIIRRLRGGL